MDELSTRGVLRPAASRARQRDRVRIRVALRELPLVLGPVDACQVEDQIGLGRQPAQSRARLAQIELQHGESPRALQRRDKIAAHETFRAGDEDRFHGSSVQVRGPARHLFNCCRMKSSRSRRLRNSSSVSVWVLAEV